MITCDRCLAPKGHSRRIQKHVLTQLPQDDEIEQKNFEEIDLCNKCIQDFNWFIDDFLKKRITP